jgi:hypothetical protein
MAVSVQAKESNLNCADGRESLTRDSAQALSRRIHP